MFCLKVDEKVKELICRNKKEIYTYIEELTNKKLNHIEHNMKINYSNNKLKELLKKECMNYVYDKIEHKIIVQELYSNGVKEEALNKLPQWVVNLR